MAHSELTWDNPVPHKRKILVRNNTLSRYVQETSLPINKCGPEFLTKMFIFSFVKTKAPVAHTSPSVTLFKTDARGYCVVSTVTYLPRIYPISVISLLISFKQNNSRMVNTKAITGADRKLN